MNNEINITEEDIFCFVNYPNSITKEKRIYIASNRDKFFEMIRFYEEFKVDLTPEERISLEEKVEQILNISKTITLTPTSNNVFQNQNSIRLAAASATLEKKANSISFADPEQKFLIRIIQTDYKKLLYFLSNVPIQPKTQLKLELHPSNVKYIISDINEALEIDADSEIESIDITVMV